MRRRTFLASSLFGMTAFACGSFAAEPATEPSAFYFDSPWEEGETAVLGDLGRLFVHEDKVYCQPGKFRVQGAGIYIRPFGETKKRLEAKERVSKSNKIIAADVQGQLIVTSVIDNNAKWSIQRDREQTDKVIKKIFPK
jgi:hypothetical protein